MMKGELSQTAFVVSITLIAWTALAVGPRFWDRFRTARVPGWDDGLIILSWVSSVAICSTVAASVKYGLGVHHRNVSQHDHATFLKLQMFTSISYSIGITSAKASFAILYLRLFPIRGLAILNKIVIAFLLSQAIEETLIVLFKCTPVNKSWNPSLHGHCLDLHPLWYTTFAFNFVTDIILFSQPIFVTWRLRMPVVKRIELGVMLSLGFFVTGMSFIRLKYVLGIGSDDTYELAEAFIWSAAEVCSLIVCSCVPSIRRIAVNIPCLSTALRSVTGRSSNTYAIEQDITDPHEHSSQKETNRSKTSKNNSTTHSRATTASETTNNDTKEEDLASEKRVSHGTIITIREIIHDTHSREDNTVFKASNIT